jgi:hypothetical protein
MKKLKGKVRKIPLLFVVFTLRSQISKTSPKAQQHEGLPR